MSAKKIYLFIYLRVYPTQMGSVFLIFRFPFFISPYIYLLHKPPHILPNNLHSLLRIATSFPLIFLYCYFIHLFDYIVIISFLDTSPNVSIYSLLSSRLHSLLQKFLLWTIVLNFVHSNPHHTSLNIKYVLLFCTLIVCSPKKWFLWIYINILQATSFVLILCCN